MNQVSVLVADRHAEVLEALKTLLETTFETVATASDSASLFEAVEKLRPDVVVVDLSLSSSGAVMIVRELKSRYAPVKIIALSIYDEPSIATEALASGAMGFVLKASAASDLIPAVENALKGRIYMSPAVADQLQRRD